MIAAAAYLLHKVGHLPDWTLAAGVFVAALIVFVVSTRAAASQAAKQTAQQTGTQVVVQGAGLEKNIEDVDQYYRKNNGRFMQEIEQHFQRLAAHFADPTERERFFIRTISNGALMVFHDGTWNTIFRSQLDMLHELNTQPAMTLEQVKPYYDAAAIANANLFGKYSFEQWLAYLRGQNVLLQDGNVVQITVRGKDFLRYLVQEGRAAKDRIN